jgi:hypothetical protein
MTVLKLIAEPLKVNGIGDAKQRREKVKAIQSAANLFAWFDITQHPAMQAQQRTTAESVLKFTQLGVPLNDLIEAHDLPYRTQDWGNDWWINMGQVPARFALEAGVEGITGPSLPEEPEPNKQALSVSAGMDDGRRVTSETQNSTLKTQNSEAQRLRLWRNWVVTWIGIEKEYSDSLRIFFVRQQRQLVKKLQQALSVSAGAETQNSKLKTQNSSFASKAADEIIARVVFDLKVEDGKLKVINHVYFGKASELGIRQAVTEILGLKGEELNKRAAEIKLRAAVKRSMLVSSRRITNINANTQDAIAAELQEGLEAGEGLNELTSRIKETFKFRRTKAQGIARTQTSGAVGTGRHEGFRSSGIELKTWLSSRDAHVRDSHREAESKYEGGIPIDSFFELTGGRVLFPGDPSGPAGEIINCRCIELVKKAAGKDYDIPQQFYSYSDMQRDLALESKESPDGTK